jgi:alcohol dehydrogenase class IV
MSPARSRSHSVPLAVSFEFATATRIIFGAGKLRELAPIAKDLGRRALFVQAQPTLPSVESVMAALPKCVSFPVAGEPTLDIVRRGVAQARADGCDCVIAMGGGSVIDTGKAIAVLLTNGGDPLDYVEIVGHGQPITKPSAPCIAIPTTAGTGAEVTRNAVLGAKESSRGPLEHAVKVSLRSPFLLPSVALVDPELTYDLPAALTATTGLDALTQLIEPFVSRRANPLTDALCREGMRRAARSLRNAYESPSGGPGSCEAAREDMMLASLFGGLALANAGLGAVHGFAGPIGGMFTAPHGAVCAALLPHAMAVNVAALQPRRTRGMKDEHATSSLTRYDEVGRILTGRKRAVAADGVAWVQELVIALRIPKLSAYGVTERDFPLLVEKAKVASSMMANPIALTDDELMEILGRALQ